MHYGAIKTCDIANGQGVRTSLFVSGCTHRCPGCFQPETWSFTYGKPFTDAVADEIVESLTPSYISGLTVLGGEPMEPDNQRGLVDLLERIKAELPNKTIWVYTGDLYEELMAGSRHTDVTDRLLACVDVLVDGPYIDERRDITLRFRGSTNQRIIDVPKTRAAGQVVLWEDDPVYSTHSM